MTNAEIPQHLIDAINQAEDDAAEGILEDVIDLMAERIPGIDDLKPNADD